MGWPLYKDPTMEAAQGLEKQARVDAAIKARCVPCLHFKGHAWGSVICEKGYKWPKEGLCEHLNPHPARAARKAGL